MSCFSKAFSHHCFRLLSEPVMYQINEACIIRPKRVYTVPGDTSASFGATTLLGTMAFKVRFHINRILLRLQLGVVSVQSVYNVLFFMRAQRLRWCNYVHWCPGTVNCSGDQLRVPEHTPVYNYISLSRIRAQVTEHVWTNRYYHKKILERAHLNGMKLWSERALGDSAFEMARFASVISFQWKLHI